MVLKRGHHPLKRGGPRIKSLLISKKYVENLRGVRKTDLGAGFELKPERNGEKEIIGRRISQGGAAGGGNRVKRTGDWPGRSHGGKFSHGTCTVKSRGKGWVGGKRQSRSGRKKNITSSGGGGGVCEPTHTPQIKNALEAEKPLTAKKITGGPVRNSTFLASKETGLDEHAGGARGTNAGTEQRRLPIGRIKTL